MCSFLFSVQNSFWPCAPHGRREFFSYTTTSFFLRFQTPSHAYERLHWPRRTPGRCRKPPPALPLRLCVMPTFWTVRQLASRGHSIEEITPSPKKQKSRRAVTQRLLAELSSYARNVRTTVTVRFLVVNNESAVFVFFRAGRKKKWRRLPQREIFTAQFFHSLFCKSPLRLEQKPCTHFYVTMPQRKTIAGLHRQRLPKDFLAASAASKITLLNLSEKNSFPSNGSNTVLLFTIFCALKNCPKSKRQVLPTSSQKLTAMRQNLAT